MVLTKIWITRMELRKRGIMGFADHTQTADTVLP